MGSSRPTFVAVMGPTATGKSALALDLAAAFRGEIVNCDSTAVYRGFDIGTDKTPAHERHGVPHHLVDIADPTEVYTAARFAVDAARAIRDIHVRGRVPIVVGGSGLYFRALTRGLFPGPASDDALRDRLGRLVGRHGNQRLHRVLARVDPASAERISPNDVKRMVRALEVYFVTGVALSTQFANTVPPLPDFEVCAIGLRMSLDALAPRLAARVDRQVAAGIVDEVRGLLASGVPATARPFGGLVYRQTVEYLRGVRTLDETRTLIARENRQYARRQLIWFRKEPTLVWFDGPGESTETQRRVREYLGTRGLSEQGSRVTDA